MMRPAIRSANWLFLLVLLLAISAGAWAQSRSLHWGLFFTEVGVVLLPTLSVLTLQRRNWRATLLLEPIPTRTIGLSLAVGLAGWPIIVLLGLAADTVMQTFGPLPPIIPPVANANDAIAYAFLFSVLAPVCEETLTRGYIQRAYEQQGLRQSILYGALFFGLFHLSPTRFLPMAFLGWVIGQAYARSRSLYSSMLVHAANNMLGAGILIAAGPGAGDTAPDASLWQLIACLAGPALMATPLLWGSLKALGPLPDAEPDNAPVRRPLLSLAFGAVVALFALASGLEIALRAGWLPSR
jgi:membrane protease YdiL (CAAX protease family)